MDAERGKRRLSGGSWRRLIAGIIDAVLVCALVSAAGVLAYAPSHGAVRIKAPLYSTGQCVTVVRDPRRPDIAPHLPPGAVLPAGFRADSVTSCTRSLFGREFDRTAQVTMTNAWTPADGVNVFAARTLDYPLDQAGRATHAWYIDWTEGPAIILVLALFEGLFGAGLGKAFMGLTVIRRHGSRASLPRTLVRNSLLWGWWALAGVGGLFIDPAAAAGEIGPTAWAIWGGAVAWMLLIGLSLIFTKPSPLHDIWSGLKVAKR